MWVIPGSLISRRAIFSSVLRGTPLPSATSRHLPFDVCSCAKTYAYMDSVISLDTRPILGFYQPAHGVTDPVAYIPMGRSKKSNKYMGLVTRQIVAKNLRARLRDLYGDKKNHILLFENDYGVTFSTTQRILNEASGATVDTLELIAGKLGIAVYELLIPPPETQRMMQGPQAPQSASSTQYEPMVRRKDESREHRLPQTPAAGAKKTRRSL